jgi:predicted Zn finger-like uncharacterized protein
MILTCSNCSTRYQADPTHFAPPGRNVRCAKCGYVWFQAPPEAELEPEPEHEPVIASSAPADGRADDYDDTGLPPAGDGATASEMGSRLARFGGWLGLIALCVIVMGGLISYRQTIATVWPPSASFYALVGMPVNVRGLDIRNVTYRQEDEDGQPVLTVSGQVANVTGHELPVPKIQVVLSGVEKQELYRWNFDLDAATLEPGKAAPFATRLSNPPHEASTLTVQFVNSGAAP